MRATARKNPDRERELYDRAVKGLEDLRDFWLDAHLNKSARLASKGLALLAFVRSVGR